MFISGLLRYTALLAPWRERLASDYDVAFWNLPGHGGVPPLPVNTLDTFTRALCADLERVAKGRPVVVVGESLGGLVAMSLPDQPTFPLKAVIAVDPPISTGELTQLHDVLARYLPHQPNPYLAEVAWQIFGYRLNATMEPRSYRHLIRPRPWALSILMGENNRTTDPSSSLVTDADRIFIQAAGVEWSILPGGHILLSDAAPATEKEIRRACELATHGSAVNSEAESSHER